MRTLFGKLKETITNEGDAVLVSVVASSGSTPRGSGAHMLVTEQGRVCGTIGGGAVEYKSEQMAADVLRDKSSLVEHFRLHANDVADLGMICGGAVDVYFRYIPANDRELLELADRIENLFAAHEEFWLICEMTGGSMGDMAVYSRKSGSFGAEVSAELISKLGSKPAQYEIDGHVYYCEQLQAPGKVYIFGGGHVAQELVPALARVGFRCVVIEDRPEFAKPELFEGRAETRLVDTAELSAVADEIDENDYVCIMTRGHKDDFEVQKHILRTKARYIGVIGSPHKKKAVFDRLREFGYCDEDFARVTSPIGLDIGGETPAEIAVSITAQLIMVRAGRPAGAWEV
ncbi:MAG: XdhC family protein [Oscillospiraceae bacterium]|nr:XdhC family protein [Oscillospiraceae bacterium]